MEMSFPLKLQRGHCAPRYLPRPAQKSEDTTCRDTPGQLFCEIPLQQVQQLPTVRIKISTNPLQRFSEFLTSPGMLCGTACRLPCSNSPAAQVRVRGLQQKIEKSGKLLNYWRKNICLVQRICAAEKKKKLFPCPSSKKQALSWYRLQHFFSIREEKPCFYSSLF